MSWTPVAPLDRLPIGRAVAARVDGVQLALVRLDEEQVHALGNLDPFSRAHVMSRGIVGSASVDGRERRTLASPMYKHTFDVETGCCLSDPTVSLGVWQVRVVQGVVQVGDRVDVPAAVGQREPA